MSFLKETDTDFGALYSKLEEDIKDNMDEDKLRAYEDCSFVTTKHAQMKSRLLNLLLSFMQQKEIKYAAFLKPVIIGNEAAPSFRHKSVSAHKTYNKTSGISETNRCIALGIIKK